MSAIDELFRELRAKNQKAFMPFLTAGDPNLRVTQQLIRLLDELGCHLCEVGIPYSDPIADGPVIQASYTRALEHKIRVPAIISALAEVSPTVSMPLVTMVSYAIVYRYGLNEYVDAAKNAGVAGVDRT